MSITQMVLFSKTTEHINKANIVLTVTANVGPWLYGGRGRYHFLNENLHIFTNEKNKINHKAQKCII